MADTGPVTELVEMSLLVPLEDFLPTFTTTFLPVLLAAPGILSVRTGPKYSGPHCEVDDRTGISITQWSSLQAHEDFLNGLSADAFFKGLGDWMSGPPTVGHFMLGSLRGYEGSAWISMATGGVGDSDSDRISQDGTEAVLAGRSVEDEGVKMHLSVHATEEAMRTAVRSAHSIGKAFGFRVQSFESPPGQPLRGKL
ncbi:hypothetical protein LTR53_005519 [Teratosphaeriaceae sp. CCFEE 6253]|nr:hypothetical protein LTR53_005519 [Teratosphaeriaceae sp. CCFEE 6253]